MAKSLVGSAHAGMMYGLRWTWDYPFYTMNQKPMPIVGFRRSDRGGRISMITFGPVAILMVRLLNRDEREE